MSTILLLIVFAAFWAYPCQAGNVVYYAPDGSQITKAEYDRLVSGKTKAYQKSKKATPSKPLKESSRLASRSGSKVAAVKANRTASKQPRALPRAKISEIRESDIRKIAKKLLQSTNKMDSQGLIAYLAPSYKVTLKTDDAELSLARDEYLVYLEEGWSGVGFYRARMEDEHITISPDRQKATLDTNMVEIASRIDGSSLKLRSQQK